MQDRVIKFDTPICEILIAEDYALEGCDPRYINDMEPRTPENVQSLDRFKNNKEITVSHLLTHTSGLLEGPKGLHFDEKAVGNFNYANYGYQLLAGIVQNVNKSGQSFEEYIRENIFKDIMHCAAAHDQKVPESEPAPFIYYKGKLRSHDPLDKKFRLPEPDGNGCWWTSANDLSQFMKTLFDNKYFKKQETLEKMVDLGFNKNKITLKDGSIAYLHGGGFPGRSAVACRIEGGKIGDKPLFVICLSNRTNGQAFLNDIFSIVEGNPDVRPFAEDEEIDLKTEELHKRLSNLEMPYNKEAVKDFLRSPNFIPFHVMHLLKDEIKNPELGTVLEAAWHEVLRELTQNR